MIKVKLAYHLTVIYLIGNIADLYFGFGAYQYIVPGYPAVDGLYEFFLFSNVLQLYLYRFPVLFYKIKYVMAELDQNDLRSEYLRDAVPNDQEIISVNVDKAE